MSLLSVARNAAMRLAVAVPDTIVDNTEETAQRLLSLANQSGREMARRHEWSFLTKEHTFIAVNDEIQTNAPIPSDFDRIINGTVFNRTAKRRVVGPLTAEEWQVQMSLTASVVPEAFRIRGNQFLMTPAPADGDTIVYEYVSKWWADVNDDGSGDNTEYTTDTAVALLDEEAITVDVVWRFQQAAGLSYAETYRTAQIMIADRIARDGGRRIVDLGRARLTQKPRVPYIPDGSWTL